MRWVKQLLRQMGPTVTEADLPDLIRAYDHAQFDPGEAAWRELLGHERFRDGEIVVIEIAKLQPGAGAKAQYDAFVARVTPLIQQMGGSVIKVTDILMPGVGDVESQEYAGGTLFLVRYPTRATYLRTLLSPVYQTANRMRTAALAETTLLIGRDTIPAAARLLFRPKRPEQIPTPRVDGKSPDQLVKELLQIYRDGGADPSRRQLEALLRMDGFRTRPLHYLNLYQFQPGASAATGDEGHKAYNRTAQKQVAGHGAYPYFRCEVEHQLLGPIPWHLCVFVRWPSFAVFTDLRLHPEYVEAQKHRVTSAVRYGNFVTVAREDAILF